MQISYGDFEKVEVRVGRIVEASDFPEARKPAYKLLIDFGEAIGRKRSSAQITKLYKKEDLLGRLVLCVVNFPEKRIGGFSSEVLTLGVPNKDGDVALLGVDGDVALGARMF
jgi:tRNA-binding protein